MTPDILIQPLMRLFGWSASDLSQYGDQPTAHTTGPHDKAHIDADADFRAGLGAAPSPANTFHPSTTDHAGFPAEMQSPTALSAGIDTLGLSHGDHAAASGPNVGAGSPDFNSASGSLLVAGGGAVGFVHAGGGDRAAAVDIHGAASSSTTALTQTADHGAAAGLSDTGAVIPGFAAISMTEPNAPGASAEAALAWLTEAGTASVADIAALVQGADPIESIAATAAPVLTDTVGTGDSVVALATDVSAPIGSVVASVADIVPAIAPALAPVAALADSATHLLSEGAALTAVAPVTTALANVAALPTVDHVTGPVADLAPALSGLTTPVLAIANQAHADVSAPTAMGLDHFAGVDPAGGVQTLVGMVDSADAFHVGPAETTPAPTSAVIDTLTSDHDVPLLGIVADHHDGHDASLDLHHSLPLGL